MLCISLLWRYPHLHHNLHVALEHGFSDLSPHTTCCKSSFGATDTLPCIGTMISSSLIQPNLESYSLGMLYSSAALQMSTWTRARLICSLSVSTVGGKFLNFGGSFVLLNIHYSISFSDPVSFPPYNSETKQIPAAIHLPNLNMRTQFSPDRTLTLN